MQLLPFAPPGSWPRSASGGGASGRPRVIPLGPGDRSAAVEGSVVRGERDLYAVMARAGQRLSVEVEAAEDNAALEVFAPGVRVRQGACGPEFKGAPLTGDGAGTPPRAWTGRAPLTGAYLVAVGPTRGNAAYELKLTLG